MGGEYWPLGWYPVVAKTFTTGEQVLTSPKKIQIFPSTDVIDAASLVQFASNSGQNEVITHSARYQTLWTDKNLARKKLRLTSVNSRLAVNVVSLNGWDFLTKLIKFILVFASYSTSNAPKTIELCFPRASCSSHLPSILPSILDAFFLFGCCIVNHRPAAI